MVDHLSERPGLAGQVQHQANRHFEDVEEPVEHINAAASGPPPPHADRKLADSIPRPVQQHDDFRLGIIFRVPVGKRPDHAPVDGPETTRAVGHDQAGHPVNQAAEKPRPAQADQRLLITAWLEEPGPHDQVHFTLLQFLDQPFHFTGPVLPVPVNLDGDIVPVQGGITVSRLHGAADAQVERQGDDRGPRRDLPDRIVRGTIIDYHNVEPRQSALQLLHHPAHGRPFVECRDDDQALSALELRRLSLGDWPWQERNNRFRARF